jgi:PadR family transcriptional regulator PadR
MLDPQLKRGCCEVCVLSALRREDSYGYKIIRISPFVSNCRNPPYNPILRRLEAAGC